MKVIIIGGVAGGASCATRLRRLDEHAEIIVFERSAHVSFANCGLPYHLSESISERADLLIQSPESLHARFQLDVRVKHEVLSIDAEQKQVRVRNLNTGNDFEESYDQLVIATGASSIRPPLPGIERGYTLRNMEDLDQLKDLQKKFPLAPVAVIGAGFIGLEAAENFAQAGHAVSIIEMAPQVLAPLDAEMATPIVTELENHGIKVLLNTSLQAITEDGILLNEGRSLPAQIVLLAIGVRPETNLARSAGLKIGPTGGIAVDSNLQSSDPAIYAIGDVAEKTDPLTGDTCLQPLAWAANRQGRLLADYLCGLPIQWPATLGTAIVKVCGITAAVVGSNERRLKQLNLPYQAIWIHPNSHASYYPGAETLAIKLLFDAETERIYGAQVVGRESVDKQIDVIATAIYSGLKVTQLAELELAYAPPFGSAKSPINMLGYVAQNIIQNKVQTCKWDEVSQLSRDYQILDVRNEDEFAGGHIEHALNIPLDQLRERLNELGSKPLLVYCQVGLRGYNACRQLIQHNFKAINLNGGYATWLAGQMSLPRKIATLV